MPSSTWKNPTRPDMSTGRPRCPICGYAIIGPFAYQDEMNRIGRKTACSRPGCGYIDTDESGFGKMKDADTSSFK